MARRLKPKKPARRSKKSLPPQVEHPVSLAKDFDHDTPKGDTEKSRRKVKMA